MTQRAVTQSNGFSCLPNRLHLKPIEAERFPDYMAVRTDKPGGLVAYQNGLVGFEATNVVIRVRATECGSASSCDPTLHVGPLSLLFTPRGQQAYEVDGRRFVVDEGSYLLHNLGQAVDSPPDAQMSAETFTIGFWPGFAEDVLRGLVTPDDHLLDTPQSRHLQPVRFFDQLYPHSPLLLPLLARFRTAVDDVRITKGCLEELHCDLLTALLCVHRSIGKEIEALPPVRSITRVEMYRRLHRARDFMEANLDQPLTVGQIAQEAWFSPFHFLRQFKGLFGETPHQYLTRRRLERAQHLLTMTEMSVTDICFALGFESLGSFSGLFRQRLGASPQQFRLLNRARAVFRAA